MRLRTSTARLEIRGLSEYDNDCDVKEGLVREGVPLDQPSVKWKKATRCGNQTVLVEEPEHLALKLFKKGQIRVVLVLCRLRLQDQRLMRCYNCHGYGHRVTSCQGAEEIVFYRAVDRSTWRGAVTSPQIAPYAGTTTLVVVDMRPTAGPRLRRRIKRRRRLIIKIS